MGKPFEHSNSLKMGLDSIEILVEVEKTFNINIPDNEAEKIITIGDFYNTVWRHLEGRYTDKCKSQSVFYKLRQSLFDSFQISKSNFKPTSSLNDIFPKENRRGEYLKFEKVTDLQLPDLRLTEPWQTFLFSFGGVTIIGGFVTALILINFFEYSKWLFLIPIAAIVITDFVSKTLNPKRIVIEPSSVREFTLKVLSLNYSKLPMQSSVNRKEVESVINYIIAGKVGLDLEEITPEKKIHDDLGVN